MRLVKKDSPAALRRSLRETSAPEILLRRAIVGASLVGTACMAITTLFQTGMVKHLSDPPLKGFDSDKVNASDLAYGWGMPDSPLSIGSHAASIPIVTYGATNRAETQPLVPLAATAAALPAAITAARYLFHDMPVREKAWCPYCIVDATRSPRWFALHAMGIEERDRSAAPRLRIVITGPLPESDAPLLPPPVATSAVARTPFG